MMADLPIDVRRKVQRILDAAARRILAERLDEDQGTPSVTQPLDVLMAAGDVEEPSSSSVSPDSPFGI